MRKTPFLLYIKDYNFGNPTDCCTVWGCCRLKTVLLAFYHSEYLYLLRKSVIHGRT